MPPRIAQRRRLAERFIQPIARFPVDPHRPIVEMAYLGTKTAAAAKQTKQRGGQRDGLGGRSRGVTERGERAAGG